MAMLGSRDFPKPYSYSEREKPHCGHLHWDYYSNCSHIYMNKDWSLNIQT